MNANLDEFKDGLDLNEKPKVEKMEGGLLRIHRLCRVRGQDYGVTVTEGAYYRWKAGELAQNVFTGMTADEREFLISNTTPAEWEQLFEGGDEEEEEEEGGRG